MSLSYFLRKPEVRAKLKPLRPNPPRRIGAPLKVMPHSKNYAVVGTAFDYLLRFEIERRAPHAQSNKWGAEYAPDCLHWEEYKGVGAGTPGLPEASRRYHLSPHEVGERAREMVAKARSAVAIHRNRKNPSQAELEELAGHCIGLAYLEDVYRAGRLDPRFQEVDQTDAQDLLEMLSIVPFDQILHPEVLLLNPSFGDSSKLVGAADTDLISGNVLIDFKATKEESMREDSLDQLFGYLVLSRLEHARNKSFPEIKDLALYFCRHGHLWKREATDWTMQEGFRDVEQWFIERAKELFGGRNRSRM